MLDCRGVTPAQAGFPGARLIARRRRRVRRRGQQSAVIVDRISRLTLEELPAAGGFKLPRDDWIIESRRHHPLDVSLEENRSRVRNRNAALVLGMFRRMVLSGAQAWLAAVQTRQTRFSVRRCQKQFARRDGGAARLDALVFAKSPTAWPLAK